MKRIKVMNLIVHMGMGGAQELLTNYLRYFNDNTVYDYWVYVIEESRDSKYDKIIYDEKLKVRYLNAPKAVNARGRLDYMRRKLCASVLIYKAIQDFKPDIIHTHITKILECALFPILLSNVRVRVHTLHSDPYFYAGKNLLLAKFGFNIGNIVPICINNEQIKKAKSRYGFKKGEVIYNALDFKRIYDNVVPKEIARKKLNIDNKTFVVGYIGRISPVKNLEFLIDIFHQFWLRHNNSILLIVGDGKREIVERKIKELGLNNNIILLGEVINVIPIYCALDMFMLTSFYEACSLSTLEAQLVGIKSIVSIAVPEEVIISDKVMRLSLTDGVERWVEAIEKHKTNCHIINDSTHYELNSQARKLMNLYKKYIEESRYI